MNTNTDPKPTLEFDFLTDSCRLYRRYNRPQLWRVRLRIDGRQSNGRDSQFDVDLIPNAPVMPTRMAGMAAQHFAAMSGDYDEIRVATITLYRLNPKQHTRLRAERDSDDVTELAA